MATARYRDQVGDNPPTDEPVEPHQRVVLSLDRYTYDDLLVYLDRMVEHYDVRGLAVTARSVERWAFALRENTR